MNIVPFSISVLSRLPNPMPLQQRLLHKLIALLPLLVLLAALAGSFSALAKGPLVDAMAPNGIAPVSLVQLPPQARSVMALIATNGPFRHDKDGTVFGNRERLLPAHARGYYREYTVRTPGERSRGARRIVCGGAQPTAPDACYYTADHYASFQKIAM